MATAKGFAAKAAVGKETTWGTPVVVSQLIPFVSEGLSKEFSRASDNILGSEAIQRAEITQENTSGSVELEAVYTGLDEILEAALGTKSGTGISTDPFIFSLTEDINTSLTIAIDKQVSVHEFVGVKINQLTIQGSAGDTIKVSLDTIAKSKNRAASALNLSTDIAAASPFGGRMLFSDVSCSVGGSPIGIAGFNLQLNNNLTAVYENSKEPVEILRNGKREVSLSIDIARYINDTFNDYFELDAEIPIILSATDGTNNFEINIPRAKVTKVGDPVGGAEIIKQTVEFILLKSGTSNEFEIKRYA